jgi:hypothetical protein
LALGRVEGDGATKTLLHVLDDDDRAVRDAAARTLRQVSPSDPAPVRLYAGLQRDLALHYHQLWSALDPDGNERASLAADSLRNRAINHARNALQAVALYANREAFDAALDNLDSSDRDLVAGALETLETAGEPDVVRPLLALWEPSDSTTRDMPSVLRSMLADGDPWLRACAAMVAGAINDPSLGAKIDEIVRTDPDDLVRETAAWARKRGGSMETVTTLPLMERIMFMRKVALFADLSPPDLKLVAEVATEHVYPDGETIAEVGEWGDEMHLVVSGEIRVGLDGPEGAVEIARRRPGESVGEMSIISEEPRMASLVAVGTVRTLSIDHKRFERIVWERPQASLAVMRVLCDRLREAYRRDDHAASRG